MSFSTLGALARASPLVADFVAKVVVELWEE
jgi:hypothetical protein